jgi:tRNA (cmo5U34)-methyltransferase
MKEGLYGNYDELVVKCLPEYYSLLEIVVGVIGNVCGIVDLGCGTGNLAKLISQAFSQAEVWGVDSSAEFLAIAREKCRGYNFRAILADMINFDLERCEQDCIVSSFTIHHLEDDEKVRLFRKIFRSLKPDGIFINLDMVRPRNYRQVVSKFLARMKESGLSTEFIEVEKKEMVERDRPVSLKKQKMWLEQIGFKFELLYDNGLFAAYCCRKG